VHQRIDLDCANLGLQPKGTSVVAMAGGDSNGSQRPWLVGSGELAAAWPYRPAPGASAAQGGLETPEKGDGETLRKHGYDNGGTPVRNIRGRRWRIRQCAVTSA
jgi:hypothetical protein